MPQDYGEGHWAFTNSGHIYHLEDSHGWGRSQILVYEAWEILGSLKCAQLHGWISTAKTNLETIEAHYQVLLPLEWEFKSSSCTNKKSASYREVQFKVDWGFGWLEQEITPEFDWDTDQSRGPSPLHWHFRRPDDLAATPTDVVADVPTPS